MKTLLILVMFGCSVAHATADSNFTITGTFNDGGTLTGAMRINTATGALDFGSLAISGLSPNLSAFDGVYAPVGGQWYPNFSGVIEFVLPNTTNAFEVYLPDGAAEPPHLNAPPGKGLIGYNGQDLAGAGLDAGYGIVATLASGTIVDPPADTSAPEIDPSGTTGSLTLFAGWWLLLRGRRAA